MGTSLDDDDLLADWIEPSACISGGGCSYELDLVNLNSPYYARLWTQHGTGMWNYFRFRLNHGNSVFDCSAEDPSFAPATHRGFACNGVCSHVLSFATFADYPGIRCNLDRPTSSGGARAAAVHWSMATDNPHDATVFGFDQDGQNFCCHASSDNSSTAFVVGFLGSDGSDEVRSQYQGSALPAFAQGGNDLYFGASTGDGADTLVGSSSPGAFGVLYGDSHADYMLTMNGSTYVYSGGGKDEVTAQGTIESNDYSCIIDAGSHNDIVIVRPSDPGHNFSCTIDLGVGSDVICSLIGEDMYALANPTFGPQPEIMYLDTFSYNMPNSWLTNSSSALCGHTDWISPGNPTPFGTCSYILDSVPQECATWLGP